ncbi:MAG: hypothetical protein FJZ43_01570 [Candidatus Staskawiczbacteria bacterium]|nr:hypothetical protein [Candidatus Staskawiczbacteria bacterium]
MKLEPVILREGSYGKEEVQKLKDKPEVKVFDIYYQQKEEILSFKKSQNKSSKKTLDLIDGDWVYYPWSNTLLHTISEKDNDFLKTNRNRNIITSEEQEKLSNFTIAVAGLSVGSNIATTLLYNGFTKNIKLADFDALETTNLNRVRAKLSDVGEKKIDILSRQLYEIDPYINITQFSEGLNKENVYNFLDGAKIVFEIIDDLEMKILIRKEAQELKIPVVMLTSIGDSVMIDVERYDLEPEVKIFNGLVDEKDIEDILSKKVSKEEVNKYVVSIVGSQNIPEKVKDSLKEIGKTLSGRPQLMSTVTVASGLAVFIARKIALGEKVPSGRSIFNFEDIIKND